MFEITLYANKDFLPYFKLLHKRITTKTMTPLTAIICQNQTAIMSIAVPIEKLEMVKHKVKKILAEYIVKFYKERVILEHMDLVFLNEKYQEAFLKAMLLYDMEEEIAFVMHQIVIGKKIYLDSLYWYRLRALHEKWIDFITVINQNMYEYISGESFLELLRFLITMGKRKQDKIVILFDQDGFSLQNEKRHQLKKLKDETDVLCFLIAMNPKRIAIGCMEHFTETTFQILHYLFHGQVEYLV